MAFLGGFDADQVQDDFAPIPEGEYAAVICASEMTRNKKGDGEYLKLTFKIAAVKFKGRQIIHRLNLKNSSDIAVKIALNELGKICRAVGVKRPTDSTELHNIPLLIGVKVTPDAKWNEIKSFSPLGGATPAANVSAVPVSQPGTDTPAAKPPWMA